MLLSMNYWITTHWPNRIDDEDDIPWGIYLPNGREMAGADLATGDLVLLYQSKTGRPEVILSPTGERRIIGRKQGREGIVVIARVAGNLEARGDDVPTKYADGTEIWWRWSASTEAIVSDGFVHRKKVNSVLGYQEGNSLRGFGDYHSGLKKISKDQFDMFIRLFSDGRSSKPISPVSINRERLGESADHLHLKEYVAANPSFALKEEGIEWIATEYLFPTADCADIVLRDRYGRYIGVEIEVDVSHLQVDGLLQAVKYRFMVPIMKGTNLHETRAVLIAYSISGKIKRLCEKYEVDCFEVERSAVDSWLNSDRDRRPPCQSN